MAETVVKSYKLEKFMKRFWHIAQTSHYQCWVNTNDAIVNKLKQIGDRLDFTVDDEALSLSCCEASLPGSSFLTHDVNAYHGITERFAYTRAYDDRADFTFYVNDNYLQIKYFEAWMAYIADEQLTSANRGGVNSNTYSYRMKFPRSYRSNIKISKFERDFGGKRQEVQNDNAQPKSKLDYIFYDAWPIAMNSIPVNYEASDTLKVTVSFTYSRYVVEYKKNSQLPLI